VGLLFGRYMIYSWVGFQGSKELGLTVLDEEDNETLLMHNITSDDIYRKQEGELTQYHSIFELIYIFSKLSNPFSLLETIISWRDREAATDLALSFQEAAGCSYIW